MQISHGIPKKWKQILRKTEQRLVLYTYNNHSKTFETNSSFSVFQEIFTGTDKIFNLGGGLSTR